jgi:hypothetical protein
LSTAGLIQARQQEAQQRLQAAQFELDLDARARERDADAQHADLAGRRGLIMLLMSKAVLAVLLTGSLAAGGVITAVVIRTERDSCAALLQRMRDADAAHERMGETTREYYRKRAEEMR